MLISTKTGMVNVFIEPQFAEVSSQELLTIQVSDFETFNLLSLRNEDSYRLDLKDEYVPYMAYGYRWPLGYKLGGFKQLSNIEVLEKDFSPEVEGYKWMGLYIPNPDYEPQEGEDDESEMHVGYCLPSEVDDARFGTDISYETFHVYPLFRLPTNEQLDTIWCS